MKYRGMFQSYTEQCELRLTIFGKPRETFKQSSQCAEMFSNRKVSEESFFASNSIVPWRNLREKVLIKLMKPATAFSSNIVSFWLTFRHK